MLLFRNYCKSVAVLLAPLLLASPGIAQESLPFPPTPSGSKAGPTIAQSVYEPAKLVGPLPADAPNVLILMIDHVGPALPDTFGGPIHTPTRAALLTGRNRHRVGFGQIAELANDWDGYTGHWLATTASVARSSGITATTRPHSANGTTPRRN